MTAVVAIDLGDASIVMSDLMISGAENPFRLPTVGDIRNIFPEGSGFVPNSLRQKLVVIDDRLALGWAGSFIGARIFERFIRENATGHSSSLTLIEGAWEAVVDAGLQDELDIVGFAVTDEGRYQEICIGKGWERESEAGHTAYFAGTGGKVLLESIREQIEFGAALQSPRERVLASAMATIGTLLGMEIGYQQVFLEWFGGGYEFAICTDGHVEKIRGCTYFIWLADQRSDEVFLKHVLRYAYMQDFLVIRAVDLMEFPPSPISQHGDLGFLINPVSRRAGKAEREWMESNPPNLTCHRCCHTVVHPRPPGKSFIRTLLKITNSGLPGGGFRFELAGGSMNIKTSQNFMDQIGAIE